MKNIAISLIALAAISTASFASQRSNDLREQPTYFGKYAAFCSGQCSDFAPAVNALTVAGGDQASNNFGMLNRISEENDHGRH